MRQRQADSNRQRPDEACPVCALRKFGSRASAGSLSELQFYIYTVAPSSKHLALEVSGELSELHVLNNQTQPLVEQVVHPRHLPHRTPECIIGTSTSSRLKADHITIASSEDKNLLGAARQEAETLEMRDPIVPMQKEKTMAPITAIVMAKIRSEWVTGRTSP